MYKVLIVDDEHFIRRGLGSCMDWQAWGCELIGAAASGEEAMEIVRKNRPDIVISDINMERMSGLELVEHLSFQYPEIKAILFTGIYDFNNVYSAIKFDVVDLILKPTSPSRIQQALTKAIYQIETQNAAGDMRALIKRQSAQNQRLRQAMLLASLTDGTANGLESAAALEAADLSLHHFVIVTLLLGGAKQEEGAAPASLREAEEAIAGYIETIFDDCDDYCLFTGPHSFHVLLDFAQIGPGTAAEVRGYCLELSKTIDNLTEYYGTIGISAIHTDPAELHQAKSESVNASNYAAYDRDNAAIVEYARMPPLSADTIHGLRAHLDRLSDAIEARHEEQALETLGQVADYFSAHKMQFEEVRGIGVLIADLCIRHLWNYSCNQMTDDTFSAKHKYYRNLLQCLHGGELAEILRGIVTLTVQNLSVASGSTRSLIDRVEDYVRKNYQEELSLEKIATQYHISPGYLSRLFKSKMDVSLMTYVQNKRIERAKELIDTTDLRTYEVAVAVGIPDPVYFSKTFKKVTGMRVRDYRGLAQTEER